MEIDNSDISNLLSLHIQGKLSEAEEKFLFSWINENKERQALVQELKDNAQMGRDLRLYVSFDNQEGWHKVKKRIGNQRYFRQIKRWGMVAVMVLGIGCGMFYVFRDSLIGGQDSPLRKISPGKCQAVLVLEDGKMISLGDEENDTRELFGENWEVKTTGGLCYQMMCERKNQDMKWHTLKVPCGGEYRLRLEDGTQVCLNSDSELKYPVCFNDKERKVILSGEAYFDVAPDSTRKFIVETERMEVKVFGTVFDIAAYKNDLFVYTTLLEGSVHVENKCSGKEIILQPGWQVACSSDGEHIQEVDVTVYTAWMKGRFAFKSENIEQVLRKLGRWYNVDFEIIDNSIKQKRFTGNVSRYEDISQVLDMLSLTTNVNFQMDHGKIVVTKKMNNKH